MMPLLSPVNTPISKAPDPSGAAQGGSEAPPAVDFVALLLALVGATGPSPSGEGKAVPLQDDAASSPPKDPQAPAETEEEKQADSAMAALALAGLGALLPSPLERPMPLVMAPGPSQVRTDNPTDAATPAPANGSGPRKAEGLGQSHANGGKAIGAETAATVVLSMGGRASDGSESTNPSVGGTGAPAVNLLIGQEGTPSNGVPAVQDGTHLLSTSMGAPATKQPAGQQGTPSNAAQAIQVDAPPLGVSAETDQPMSKTVVAEASITPETQPSEVKLANLAIGLTHQAASRAHAGAAQDFPLPAADDSEGEWTVSLGTTTVHATSRLQAVVPSRGAEARSDDEDSRYQEAPTRVPGRRTEPLDQAGPSLEVARRQPMDPSERPRPMVSPAGIERVVAAVRTSLSEGGMEVRLRLHPESLGDVQVHVRWDRGLLTARLEAATPAARDALEGGLHLLRDALQEQGVPVDRLHVGLRLGLEGQSRGQDPGRQSWANPAPAPAPNASADAASSSTPAPAGRLDVRI